MAMPSWCLYGNAHWKSLTIELLELLALKIEPWWLTSRFRVTVGPLVRSLFVSNVHTVYYTVMHGRWSSKSQNVAKAWIAASLRFAHGSQCGPRGGGNANLSVYEKIIYACQTKLCMLVPFWLHVWLVHMFIMHALSNLEIAWNPASLSIVSYLCVIIYLIFSTTSII